MHDIIIVGAGTAGLSAAIYGLRAGKSVLVLEGEVYGGQIINTPEIENYPGIKKVSGFEFATNLYEQAVDLGAEVVFEKVKSIISDNVNKKVITDNNEYLCRAIILATGAKNRTLNLPGEKELVGAGVSYCATCDGAFFRGRDVAVNGGGNTALEDALFLSNYCNKVYIIHRRDKFRGEEKLYEKLLKKENVEFVLDSVVAELIREDALKAVKVRNVKDNSERVIEIAGLFVAIGQVPENRSFENVIELDETGYIKGLEDCRTNEDGVFVAGDCRTKTVRQLATAAADGAVAALAACEYIG